MHYRFHAVHYWYWFMGGSYAGLYFSQEACRTSPLSGRQYISWLLFVCQPDMPLWLSSGQIMLTWENSIIWLQLVFWDYGIIPEPRPPDAPLTLSICHNKAKRPMQPMLTHSPIHEIFQGNCRETQLTRLDPDTSALSSAPSGILTPTLGKYAKPWSCWTPPVLVCEKEENIRTCASVTACPHFSVENPTWWNY